MQTQAATEYFVKAATVAVNVHISVIRYCIALAMHHTYLPEITNHTGSTITSANVLRKLYKIFLALVTPSQYNTVVPSAARQFSREWQNLRCQNPGNN